MGGINDALRGNVQSLAELVRSRALEVKPPGEYFTLKSGRRSRYYLDLRRVTLSGDGLRLITNSFWVLLQGKALFDVFRARTDTDIQGAPETVGGRPDCVGGPSLGADPLVSAMVYDLACSGFTRVRGFLARPEPKLTHGKPERIVGDLRTGDKVLLLEDTITSGNSVLESAALAAAAGAVPLAVFCVVDRRQGGKEEVESRGLSFRALLTAEDLGLDKLDAEGQG